MGLLLGFLVTGPWVGRVAAAAAASGVEPSAELEFELTDPRARYAAIVFWALIVAVVFVMVVKPLS